MNIGFIVLGIMGRPMAKNLLKAGYALTVYDRSGKFEDLVALGAKAGVSSKDVASQSDVIITMLPNSPHVKEAVLGKDGVLEGAKAGTILVDMSSIAPGAAQEICAAVKEKVIVMSDAPFSGGEPKAIDGTLAVMVGGEAKAFETVKPILEKMPSDNAGNFFDKVRQSVIQFHLYFNKIVSLRTIDSGSLKHMLIDIPSSRIQVDTTGDRSPESV
jgi:2-hydroxy-3-oxopropionate reductase